MQAINLDVPLQTMQTLSGLGSGDRGKPSLITDSSNYFCVGVGMCSPRGSTWTQFSICKTRKEF